MWSTKVKLGKIEFEKKTRNRSNRRTQFPWLKKKRETNLFSHVRHNSVKKKKLGKNATHPAAVRAGRNNVSWKKNAPSHRPIMKKKPVTTTGWSGTTEMMKYSWKKNSVKACMTRLNVDNHWSYGIWFVDPSSSLLQVNLITLKVFFFHDQCNQHRYEILLNISSLIHL